MPLSVSVTVPLMGSVVMRKVSGLPSGAFALSVPPMDVPRNVVSSRFSATGAVSAAACSAKPAGTSAAQSASAHTAARIFCFIMQNLRANVGCS